MRGASGIRNPPAAVPNLLSRSLKPHHFLLILSGVSYLPAELTRLLATIRDLDERASALADSIRIDVSACLAAPPQAGRPAGTPEDPAISALRSKITADQRLLVQWAEEKVSLATVAYDLLDRHAAELDVEAAALAAEMEADGSMAAIMGEAAAGGLAAYDSVFGSGALPPGLPGAPSMPAPALGNPQLSGFPHQQHQQQQQNPHYHPGMDPHAAAAAAAHHQQAAAQAATAQARAAQADARAKSDARRREREAAAQRAAMAADAARAEAAAQAAQAAAMAQAAAARDYAAVAAADAERRARAAAGAAGAGAGVGKPAAGGGGGARRAAGVGVGAKAEDHPAALPPVAFPDASGAFPPGSLGAAAPIPAPYAPAVPPGMRTSAPAPQAVGRLLTNADISVTLKGRRAELFWPDDNLWYLIEVTDVDVAGKRAAATYVTGETEELDLAEIVREGHMSLVTQDLAL